MPEGAFSYGEIVRSALRISWRNKFLWFFGVFVGGGLASNFNIPSGFGNGGTRNQNLPDFNQTFSLFSSAASEFAGSGPASALALQAGPGGTTIALIVGAVVLAVVLLLLYIALVVVSRGGLAASVAAIDGGEGRRFGETWRAGLSNFWRVLLQAILLFLIALGLSLAILVVVGLPVLLTFLLSQSVGLRVAISVVFALIGILLFVVVFVPFAIVSQFAVRELVVGGGGVSGSIGASYRLLRRNLGRGLLVWLLNIGLKILVGIATLIVLILLGLVLVGPGIAVAATGSETTGLVLGIIGGVLLLIPVLIITGATGTYFYSYWTLAYLRMKGVGGAAVLAPRTPDAPSSPAYASTQTDDASSQDTATGGEGARDAADNDDAGVERKGT